MRRKKQKDVCDKNISYGPPDKHQHFEEIRPRNKRREMDKDIVMKTSKQLKYFMLMACGIEDGRHH